MIHYITVYREDKDLGKAYNQEMERLQNDEDWCCFVDADCLFVNPFFGTQIAGVIKDNPKCKLFTSVTNRVGTKYQCVEGMWDENDMSEHFTVGRRLAETFGSRCSDITNNAPFSGVIMLIQKKEWKRVKGFKELGGALGVDNSIHYAVRDNGGKVMLMEGVYVMHYYRNGKIEDKNHLL